MDIEALLAALPPPVESTARALRARLLAELPDVEEQPDAAANVVGYGYGPGYKGLVCTMILSKKGVKLGFYRGTELPDPDGLLQGSGKVHRYAVIADPAASGDSKLRRLLAAARAASLSRAATSPAS